MPAAQRSALVDRALADLPSSDYDPWSAATVRRTSVASDCLLFPRQAAAPPPIRRTPDVPALILSGRLDMRTPAENGRATAKLLPRARVVEVPGNGHDQVDTDATGCVAKALKRWMDKERVGKPCVDKTNQVAVIPRPPRSLSEIEPSRQVPGTAGRVLRAVLETAREVRFSGLEAVFGGLDPRGGGLRGGSYSATDAFEGTVTLRDYEYVPGVRVSGDLTLGYRRVSGTVRVDGPVDGSLRLDTGGVRAACWADAPCASAAEGVPRRALRARPGPGATSRRRPRRC